MFVSQPFPGLPSQSRKPAAQVGTQAPLVHVVVPLAFVQTVPQAPQFVAQGFRLASQPLALFVSQLLYPAVQVPSVHVPATQVSEAFARSHTAPQAPQSVSVLMFFSQPLLGLPSQLA